MISIFCLSTVSVFLLIIGWPLGPMYKKLGVGGSYISGILFGMGFCGTVLTVYLVSLKWR